MLQHLVTLSNEKGCCISSCPTNANPAFLLPIELQLHELDYNLKKISQLEVEYDQIIITASIDSERYVKFYIHIYNSRNPRTIRIPLESNNVKLYNWYEKQYPRTLNNVVVNRNAKQANCVCVYDSNIHDVTIPEFVEILDIVREECDIVIDTLLGH